MLEAAPRLSSARDATRPLLAVEAISVFFQLPAQALFSRKSSRLHAVEDVSFTLAPRETLGIVGESGSGKTTTARAVMLQVRLNRGRIHFDGRDVTDLAGEELRRMRRHMQFVFQDPYGSLNARMTVLDTVAEPLIVHGLAKRPKDARDKVVSLLETVGLPADALDRYPHAFSGGQRQRIGIARALAISPELIVADEPVSSLDVSVRAQVVNLLQDLQQRLGLTYLFIAHDLAIVRHISHRIAIMYAGRIVEVGSRDSIYDSPRHPYTQALLSAVLEPDPTAARARPRQLVAAEPPNVIDPGPGCRYQARCQLARDRCRRETPALTPRTADHLVACFER
ncbi:MAG TPA: oligopeptide/dipeptide ABC transporter ATP-binding protein [Xanthobacteraceae bacterium]|jgi:peptide/nickel transport system ATP-binding protein